MVAFAKPEDATATTADRAGIAGGARFLDGCFDKTVDAWIAGEVAIDKGGSLGQGSAGFKRQTSRTHAVNDAEVDGFGARAHGLINRIFSDAKDGGGGARMDILTASKGGDQAGVLRHVRHQP